MIDLTYGPKVVIEHELAQAEGVEQAYIFGSWASRYMGNDGPEPNDIDVLIVGDITRRKLAEVAENLTDLAGREVNFQRVSADAWLASVDPFVTTVKNEPIVQLALKENNDS
ncbi:nucleotidyltransferase family protein [Glutamicibacter sp. NPDC087344]|uniref:nucleotidyltransferase family protein n=1 Tax=Glutamicibacter sp. NPDC087344 TaxID=3363994 RepID=UPI00380052E8